MAVFEKLTLEILGDLPLEKLEEVAYTLQVEYDPPLTEDQRLKVSEDIKYIIKYNDQFNEDVIIERRRRERRQRGRSCDDEKTAIMQKNVGLLSDAQLVFLPQIEIIRDREGNVIDKKIKYFCLDRYDDLPIAIESKINPLNDAPLTNDQLQFLVEQRDNNPYPNISVDEFLEEIEARIGEYKPPEVPKYIILGDKLEKLLKSQVRDFLVYDLNVIQSFATDLTVQQYKRFMRFHKVKIQSEDRNEAAIETLQSLINLYNLKKDYPTAALITMTIGDYMYMINKGISYQELVEDEGRPSVQWHPADVKETYYNSGELKSTVPLNDEGENHGPYSFYYENGDIRKKGNFKDGEKDGVWVSYNKNGQLRLREEYKNNILRRKTFYKDGKRDGNFSKFYENGELDASGKYKNNERYGVWTSYHENGELETRGRFKNGNKNGTWKYFNDKGFLITKEFWDQGVPIEILQWNKIKGKFITIKIPPKAASIMRL